MYLFKTSGNTLASVIGNNRHAFHIKPKNWTLGELVLISKNRSDCEPGEKQIQYVAELETIDPIAPGEIAKYFPGHEGQWKYMIKFTKTIPLIKPFNLDEFLGMEAKPYRFVQTFKKIQSDHEKIILAFLKQTQRT